MPTRSCGTSAVATALLAVAAGWLAPARAQPDKLTASDVVARHLASVGPPAARASVKTRVADGRGSLRQATQGSAIVSGPAIFLLEGNKMALQILFNFPQYPEELFAFDGRKPQIRRTRSEGRSRLGEFLNLYHHLMREGLIGGTLNTNWALLHVEQSRPELKYAGLEQAAGRPLHALKYSIRQGSGDFDIRLFFEPETFRHVRTVYRLAIRSGMRSNPDLRNSSVAPLEDVTRYTLEEEFSDFRPAGQLSLPKRWFLRYTSESPRGSGFGTGAQVWEWDIRFETIIHDEAIDPKSFLISGRRATEGVYSFMDSLLQNCANPGRSV